MVLEALNRYYHILVSDPDSDIPPFGYTIAAVHYAVILSRDGSIVEIDPLTERMQQGNIVRDVPQRLMVPQQTNRSRGIRANFLCDHSTYMFGLSDREEIDPGYGPVRFEAFRNLSIDVLQGANSQEAKAVLAFVERHDPYACSIHPVVSHYKSELLKGGRLVFRLQGLPAYIHEHPEVRSLWENYLETANPEKEVEGQCLVTGKRAPIARIHASLKGIRGSVPTGAKLVSFNKSAYESFNRHDGQGLIAPVSEQAAFAYTTALNHLLSFKRLQPKLVLGNITVICWAESLDPRYGAILSALLTPNLYPFDAEALNHLSKTDGKARARIAQLIDRLDALREQDQDQILQGIDAEMPICLLGLAANRGRLSVSFFQKQKMETAVHNLLAHYRDMQIVREYDLQQEYISVWHLLDETIPKGRIQSQLSSGLVGSFFQALLQNRPYPASMMYRLINRIRADIDDSNLGVEKINYVRSAFIKAFLIRKYNGQPDHPIHEALNEGLNDEAIFPPYVLGRVFAILEKLQRQAYVGRGVSIKDRYFTAVCAAPARIFPGLLRQVPFQARRTGRGVALEQQVKKVMQLLDGAQTAFPERFSLAEQGAFILGYYHQRVMLYQPQEHIVREEPLDLKGSHS